MGASIVPGLVASGTSILDSLFGGASQAEKDQARVARGNQLMACALNGDIGAARMILYGAQNTSSSSAVGLQHYQALWSQLQTQYPNIANAAQSAGKTPDTTGTGCPGGGSPAVGTGTGGAVVVSPVTGISTAGLVSGLSPADWLLVGGVAIFALTQQGRGRRRRRR